MKSFFTALSGSGGGIVSGGTEEPTGPATYNPATHQIGILLGGQSNAQGSHNQVPPTYLQEPLNGVYIYNAGTWEILDYPNNHQSSSSVAHGCELSLGYELQSHFGGDIYIAKYAVSSAPIYADPGRTDFNIATNEALPPLSTHAQALKAKIESLGKIPIIIMVWIQGEGDCADNVGAAAYEEHFNEILGKLATDGAAPDHIIMNVLKMSSTRWTQEIKDRYQIVIQQQENWIANNSNGYKLDMNPYAFGAGDELHFGSVQQVQIGKDVKDIITTQIISL